jgi:hypothetical protein
MARRESRRRPHAIRLLVATAAALVAGGVMVGLGGVAAHTATDLAGATPPGGPVGTTPGGAA